MPLKNTLEKWDQAVKAFLEGQYEDCLRIYESTEEISARMYYNMACAYIKLQQESQAIQCLTSAVNQDAHLAIAFYQRGVLYLKDKQLAEAKSDLHSTLTLLRGNPVINYKQLGLLYKLYLTEVLFNVAMVEIHEGNKLSAEDTLHQALPDADLGQSKTIHNALHMLQSGDVENLKAWQPSVDCVFTPPKVVTDNLQKRRFVPKAKVVSAANITDVESRFNGSRRVQELRLSADIKLQAPKSPVLAVKNLLQIRKKSPVPRMRLNKSTGDLAALALEYQYDTYDDRHLSIPAIKIEGDNLDIPGGHVSRHNKHKPSIGSLFGNNLTVVSHVLSSSCDILTAIATPSINVNDASGDVVNDTSDDVFQTSTSEENNIEGNATSSNKEGDTLDNVILIRTDDKNNKEEKTIPCVNVKYISSDTPLTLKESKKYVNHAHVDCKTDINFSKDLQNGDNIESALMAEKQPVSIQDTNKGIDTNINGEVFENKLKEEEAKQRQRPPPPTYPPPPLPSTVIITL